MKIFISYSRKDAGDFAEQIRTFFISFKYDIFTDIDSINAGEVWSKTIETNISNCDIFVVIVTYGALSSPNVDNEVLQAQKEKKRIIPCLHRTLRQSEIKWGLNKIQGVEFEDKFELARNLYSKIKKDSHIGSLESDQETARVTSQVTEQSKTPVSYNRKILIPIIIVVFTGAIIMYVVFGGGIMHQQPQQPQQSSSSLSLTSPTFHCKPIQPKVIQRSSNSSANQIIKLLSYTNTTLAANKTLFAISPSTCDIYKYNGRPMDWTRVGTSSNVSNLIAGNDFNLYKANSTGVFLWLGSPDKWKQIDAREAKAIYAAGDSVYSITADRLNHDNIYRYNGKPYDWTGIGTKGITFAAGNSSLYGFNPTYFVIFRWNGIPYDWTSIGAGTNNETTIKSGTYNRTIIASNHSVYATNKLDGHIYRYDRKPNNWTDIGSPGDTETVGRSFAAGNSTLYAVSSDGTILEWTGTAFQWTPIGGDGGKIVLVGNTLFSTNVVTGDIYRYNGKPNDWTPVG